MGNIQSIQPPPFPLTVQSHPPPSQYQNPILVKQNPTNATSELSFLCINCEKYIPNQNLEKHSQQCTKISEEVHRITNSSDYIESINFRLYKLSLALTDLTKKSNKKNYLQLKILQNLSNISIQGMHTDDVQRINDLLKMLEGLQLFQFATFTQIYQERLKLLLVEKDLYLKTQLKNANQIELFRQILSKQKQEIDNLQKEMSQQSTTHKKPNSLRMKVHHGDQPVKHRCEESREKYSLIISTRSAQSVESTMTENTEMSSTGLTPCNQSSIDSAAEDNPEKTFFSLCILEKFRLATSHPSQKIKINKLWQKAQEICIDPDEFQDFIKEEFKNPERWTEKTIKKGGKKQAKNRSQTYLKFLKSIPEEDVDPVDS